MKKKLFSYHWPIRHGSVMLIGRAIRILPLLVIVFVFKLSGKSVLPNVVNSSPPEAKLSMIFDALEEGNEFSALQLNGIVTDTKGKPLNGVTVMIKGSQKGTYTDNEGAYNLEASEDAVLVFSFLGYKTKEVPVNGRQKVDVVLVQNKQVLGEVVVTALGISKTEKALPYAITEINGKSFTKAREVNVGNALSGKVAGVDATSTATGPGGSSRVIIRGNGSLSGNNQPLYVIDGVPIDNTNQGSAGTYGGTDQGDGLSSVNPDDIESISVLKGGTAAALYGSRAANGVILITTKTGKARKGIGVEFNSTATFESPLSSPDWQYEYGSGNLGQAPTTKAEAIANGRTSWGTKLDGSMVIQPDGVSRPYIAQKDNYKHFYDLGKTFSNTLALVGGDKNANFRFSVSNLDNSGIVPNNSLDRKTFSLSSNVTLAKKITFSGRAQYNIEKNRNRTNLVDFTENPDASVKLLANNIDVRTLAPGYDSLGYETPWNDYVFVVNPYFAINKVKNGDDRKRLIGNFLIRYNITDFLYARARLGVDYYSINGYNITPTGILYSPQGSMTENQKVAYETNSEALLGFNKNFGDFSVDALVGGNQMHRKENAYDFSSGLFNVPFDYFITNGSSLTSDKTFAESAINSIFESADIGYNDYLYLSLTGRTDWFSTLSPESNHIFYPSVGLSFVFSDAWKAKPSWLSYGKVRASWAQVGGGAPDPYALNLIYVAQTSSHLGQPLMNINGSTIPNNLRPYTSTTTEFGLNMKAFDNRVGVDVTLYGRTTTNDIVRASVSSASSYSSVSLNVGEVQNKGIELLLSGTPFRSNKFTWDISYNLAYNKNTVVKLAPGLTSLALPGATSRTGDGKIYDFEGMPFGMIAGYKVKQDDKGNIVYNSANGLPIRGDFMALGRGVPPLTTGLSNSFKYGNFSLDILLDGKFGSKMYTATNAYGTYYGLDKRTVANDVREKGITVSGVDQDDKPFTKTISAQQYYQGIAYSITNDFVQDAGFIKLRQLTLGYSFSDSFLSKTPFQSASLSFVARNLLLLYSQIKNVDPESSFTNSDAQGLEDFGVPPTRSFGFNLLLSF